MTTPTLEDLLKYPQLRQELVRAAHRERAEGIGRLFRQLAEALKPRHTAPRSLATGRS